MRFRSPSSAMDRLGVVVVHYGSPLPTHRCVRSVLQDPSPVKRSVVVVDNSNNFGGDREVVVIPAGDNPGYGEGVNRGVRALADLGFSNFVALNHDVEVLGGFLHAVNEGLSREDVGAVGGPLYLSDGRTLWAAGGLVFWPLGIVIQFSSYRRAWRAREVGFLPGAALGFRGEAFLGVGGFDPRFFMYHEDLDLCLRLRRAGFRLWYSPRAAALHHVGMATGSLVHSSLYLEHLTKTRLLAFRPFAFRLWLALVHSLYAPGRAAALALAGRRQEAAAILRGHRVALAKIRWGPLPVSRRRTTQPLLATRGWQSAERERVHRDAP